MGNIMWAPDDCDVVEFNLFPGDTVISEAVKSKRRLRIQKFRKSRENGTILHVKQWLEMRGGMKNKFLENFSKRSESQPTPVRSVFLNAFWAKGGSSKFYIIEPSIRHPHDFYLGKMRISPRELLQVFSLIGNGSLVTHSALTTWTEYEVENHSFWKTEIKKKKSHPKLNIEKEENITYPFLIRRNRTSVLSWRGDRKIYNNVILNWRKRQHIHT
jgi:hypothetical protein